MTHNLVLNYNLLEHMDVYVSNLTSSDSVIYSLLTTRIICGSTWYRPQRPIRASKDQLTRFHSDEYIDFLETVTPETSEEMTGGGVRCEPSEIS